MAHLISAGQALPEECFTNDAKGRVRVKSPRQENSRNSSFQTVRAGIRAKQRQDIQGGMGA
jgi:hypothetical protein